MEQRRNHHVVHGYSAAVVLQHFEKAHGVAHDVFAVLKSVMVLVVDSDQQSGKVVVKSEQRFEYGPVGDVENVRFLLGLQ
ncbi:hypothetical protein SDC9_203026 [bioreactor metagenome]|uniref:Uncharacterized protein n=1 Tax=bioreactor metagenome TaxID=1076179 RepID=A0A645J4C6_9ZZZZ